MRATTIIAAGIVGLLVGEAVIGVVAYRGLRSMDDNIKSGNAASIQATNSQSIAIQAAINAATAAASGSVLSSQYESDPTVDISLIKTTCAPKHSCSANFSAAGKCNGREQLVVQQAWEKTGIKINQVTVGFLLDGRFPHTGVVHIGNSAHNDIMAMQIGSGTTVKPLNPAFDFPAIVDDHTHVDAHVWCIGQQNYQVFVLLDYELAGDVPAVAAAH